MNLIQHHLDRCSALLTAFEPVVRSVIDPWLKRVNEFQAPRDQPVSAVYGVTFVDTLDRVDGLMYHFTVRLEGGALDLIELTEMPLGQFGAAEDIPNSAQTVDGLEFVIGDGDDLGAIMFQGGEFRIWLRHLPE